MSSEMPNPIMPSRKPRSKPEIPPDTAVLSRSENMRRIKSKNTGPEVAVRKLVYSLGYRYRLHHEKLPGKPDLVFAGRRKVIFVHGCFWHSHGCRLSHNPRTNTAYWSPKLAQNAARDIRNQVTLEQLGWKTLTLWECQITNRKTDLLTLIRAFLES